MVGLLYWVVSNEWSNFSAKKQTILLPQNRRFAKVSIYVLNRKKHNHLGVVVLRIQFFPSEWILYLIFFVQDSYIPLHTCTILNSMLFYSNVCQFTQRASSYINTNKEGGRMDGILHREQTALISFWTYLTIIWLLYVTLYTILRFANGLETFVAMSDLHTYVTTN